MTVSIMMSCTGEELGRALADDNEEAARGLLALAGSLGQPDMEEIQDFLVEPSWADRDARGRLESLCLAVLAALRGERSPS